MFQRTGNDEIHPGECLICTLATFFVSCLKGQLRQQMIDDRIILSIRKECRPRLRQNFPDSINLDQLFHGGVAHRLKIIFKVTADHLGICQTDACNAQTVHHSRQGRVGCLLSRRNQIVIRFLPESVHLDDLFLMAVQMENVRILMNHTDTDKFLQRRL